MIHVGWIQPLSKSIPLYHGQCSCRLSSESGYEVSSSSLVGPESVDISDPWSWLYGQTCITEFAVVVISEDVPKGEQSTLGSDFVAGLASGDLTTIECAQPWSSSPPYMWTNRTGTSLIVILTRRHFQCAKFSTTHAI